MSVAVLINSNNQVALITDSLGRVAKHTGDTAAPGPCCCSPPGPCYYFAYKCTTGEVQEFGMTCDDAHATPFFSYEGDCYYFNFSDTPSTDPPSPLLAPSDVTKNNDCSPCCGPCVSLCGFSFSTKGCTSACLNYDFTNPDLPPCDNPLSPNLPSSLSVCGIVLSPVSGTSPPFSGSITIDNPVHPGTDSLIIQVTVNADCTVQWKVTSNIFGDFYLYPAGDGSADNLVLSGNSASTQDFVQVSTEDPTVKCEADMSVTLSGVCA